MIETIICLLALIVVFPWAIYKFSENTRLPEPIEKLTETMPLSVSNDDFKEKFIREIQPNKHYFIGRIDCDAFLLRYIPPGSLFINHPLWITLKGQIDGDVIRYGFTRLIAYRKRASEKERLMLKIKELACF